MRILSFQPVLVTYRGTTGLMRWSGAFPLAITVLAKKPTSDTTCAA